MECGVSWFIPFFRFLLVFVCVGSSARREHNTKYGMPRQGVSMYSIDYACAAAPATSSPAANIRGAS